MWRPVDEPDQRVHQVDVGLEDFADPGPLDLDRDELAGREGRPMDLADRGRGERLRVERPEDRLGQRAQLLADDLADLRVRERPTG